MEEVDHSVVADDAAPCGQSSTSLVCSLTDGFWAWFAAKSPSVEHAAIHLDLSVFSESTTTPVPLIRLHHLRLGLEDVIAPS